MTKKKDRWQPLWEEEERHDALEEIFREMDNELKFKKNKSKFRKPEIEYFRNLFLYYYELLKNYRAISKEFENIIENSTYYVDLSKFLKNEFLFSTEKDSVEIYLPRITKVIQQKNNKEIFQKELFKQNHEEIESEMKEDIDIRAITFDSVKTLYLKSLERPYEFELHYGFCFLAGFKDNEKIFAPVLFLPCQIDYDTINNKFLISLTTTDINFNSSILKLLTESEETKYIEEKILPSKPEYPVDIGKLNSFLESIITFASKIRSDFTPLKDFQLNPESYRDILYSETGEKRNLRFIPKVYLYIARKANIYIIEDLKKLSEKEEFKGSAIEVIENIFKEKDEIEEYLKKDEFAEEFLLFPFESNDNQRRIAHLLDKRLIQVKGPPGTGKSQTISNLICHLVANRKTVLVTSQKNKALEVIRDMLSEIESDYLFRILLKDDKETKQSLIDSINSLDHHLDSLIKKDVNAQIKNLKDKLKEVSQNIKQLESKWYDLIKIESEEKISKDYEIYDSLKEYDLIDRRDDFEPDSIEKEKVVRFLKLNEEIKPYKKEIECYIYERRITGDDVNKLKDLFDRFLNLIEKKFKEIPSIEPKEIIKFFGDTKKLIEEPQIYKQEFLKVWSELIIPYWQCYIYLKKQQQDINKLIRISGSEGIDMKFLNEQSEKATKIRNSFEEIFGYHKFLTVIPEESIDKLSYIENLINSLKKRSIFNLIRKRRLKNLIIKDYKNRPFTQEVLNEIEKGFKFRKIQKEIVDLLDSHVDSEEMRDLLKNIHTMDMLEFKRKIEIFDRKHRFLLLYETLNDETPKEITRGLLKEINKKLGEEDLKSFLLDLEKFLNFKIIEKELKEFKNTLLGEKLFSEIEEIENYNEGEFISNKVRMGELLTILDCIKEKEEIDSILNSYSGFKNTLLRLKEDFQYFNNVINNWQKIMEAYKCRKKIEKYEIKYRDYPDEIAESLLRLREDKRKIIKTLVKLEIEKRLLKLCTDDKPFREIKYFAKILKEGRRSYESFEKLKEKEDLYEIVLSFFPCWIMTIEDGARIFPLKKGLFDYVIIDEASQCCLPFSFPILYRARNAIIVGDDKQLPDVTSIWLRTDLNRSLIIKYNLKKIPKFEALDLRDNSLFDSCTIFTRSTLLNEHFRSYPEIITFSNEKFYQRKLELRRNSFDFKLGKILNIIKAEGAYDDPQTKINEKEAREIINYLKKFIYDEKYKGKTFGILSLFHEQADFLRKLVYEDEDILRKIKEKEIIVSTVDGFQGDERDIILYSFRYAPNSNPNIFTLVRTEDGERRANVAFTRARDQIFCFISEDVDKFPDNIVKEFLKYCSMSWIPPKYEQRFDSDFEKEIHELLTIKPNIRIFPQFSTCGFEVDLLIFDNEGRRLLVECDGWKYHYDEFGQLLSDDVRRQEILERAGWKVYRIVSRKFYKNKSGEIEKLLRYFYSLH